MLKSFVFHESFDSTRTADDDSGPNLAQAQAEALVSLLLGHSLSVINTYAFDSRGVLDLVQAVLSARDEVKEELRIGTAPRRRLLRARPFLLTWYGADSFAAACAGQLRRIDPDFMDKRFLLSAWRSIDLDASRRNQLADTLLSAPNPEPPQWLQEYKGLPGQFEAVTAISRYSRHYDRGRPANTEPAVDLVDYLDYYHRLEAGGSLRELARARECPEDVAMVLWQRIDHEFKEENGREKLKSRSWIHVAVQLARIDNDPDLGILVQLKELVDTFYNARLAQSGYAQHDFLSSVPRSSDTDELKNVNNLAVGVISHRRSDASTPPLAGIFTAPANEPQLAVRPLSYLFRAYWEIIADSDRYRTWQESCDLVNRLLRDHSKAKLEEGKQRQDEQYLRDAWGQRFREAWSDHMALLSRQLPDVVQTDDGTLRVVVRQGASCFQHAHHAGPLTAEDAETALATGRYVSNMNSWVNV